jgi:hypothetical protein
MHWLPVTGAPFERSVIILRQAPQAKQWLRDTTVNNLLIPCAAAADRRGDTRREGLVNFFGGLSWILSADNWNGRLAMLCFAGMLCLLRMCCT